MDVDLDVHEGKVNGLIGPNGAGKTTLFNVITGLQSPNRGRVRLDDHDITRLKPHRRARLGIARTFQRLEIIGTLSACENVQMAAEAQRKKVPGRDERGRVRLCHARARRDRACGRSTGGRVTDRPGTLGRAGRALATSPSVLLLDEPSSGLNHEETVALGRVLRTLAADGLAVLLVEHDMGLVMEICDNVNVLDYGELIARGDPASVQADPAVQAAYLGQPVEPRPNTGAQPLPSTNGSSGNVGGPASAPVAPRRRRAQRGPRRLRTHRGPPRRLSQRRGRDRVPRSSARMAPGSPPC